MQEFAAYQPLIFSIAYRMTGSVTEAEDIVQESFLRLHRVVQQGEQIESPKSYLAAIATRLAINHLRSARARRETYIGEWLPEPVTSQTIEMADSLSMALLKILETLSPVERAVFLLREVFDYEYSEIAEMVEKSEDNCRQILTRAKRHVDAGKPRFEPSREKREELVRRFFAASEHGDLDGLVSLLADDVTFHGDGGGKGRAIRNPINGAGRVAQFLVRMFAQGKPLGVQLKLTEVNGQPGAMALDSEGRLISVFSVDVVDGAIHAIRAVINPDKLRHFGKVSDLSALR